MGKFADARLIAVLLTMAFNASVTCAVASELSTANTVADKKSALEEVIVTAQRREESAQDVAISITVFDPEQVANANMTNSSDIATYTPSVSTDTRFGNENTSFSIRGFTQALRSAATVATYFAEVVAPRGQSSQTSGDGAGPGAMFDLQNIQVLKGPQGTLFGRNSTGGAVLLVPNKPTNETEGYIEVSGGDFDTQRLQAVLNFPVTDNFRVRFGMDNNQRDGHLNNITHIGASELGNTDYTATRLGLAWDLTETIENYTILSYVDSESHGYTAALFACNPSPNPGDNTFYAFTGPSCAKQLADQAASGNTDFYDVQSGIKTPITSIEEKRLINTTTWNFSENLTFKNILAYAHLESWNGSNIFGTHFVENDAVLAAFYSSPAFAALTAGPLGTTTIPAADPRREFAVGISVINPDVPVASQETWVEEIQLQGQSLAGKLIWQTGLYYENSRPDGPSGNKSVSFMSCELATIEQNDPSQYNCYDATNGAVGGVQSSFYENEYLNRAVYFQGTYDVLQQLSVTAGVRYTWDEVSSHGIRLRQTYAGTVRNEPIIAETRPEIKDEAPTGLLEFNYRPLDGVMLYAKYIRGYRQGGTNLGADPGLDTFDRETVDTYEIGAKTSFGGPVPGRFNISVFDNDLTDMQLNGGYISPTAGPTTAVSNIGKGEIKGVEVEAMFRLLDSLTLSLSYSKLDTELLETGTVDADKIREAVTNAAGGPQNPTAVASGELAAQTFSPIGDVGEEIPLAAKYSLVASLNYQLPLPVEIGMVTVGVTYVDTGEQRSAASSVTPYAMLPSYQLVNLNAAWHDILGSHFDLSLFGTNVTDEEYVTYVSGTYGKLGFESRQVGFPKLYGARLRYSF